MIEQSYLSSASDYGRDYYPTWTYPVPITTLVYAELSAWCNAGSRLIYQNVTNINTSLNRISGHCFGFDGSTPITRYGYTLTGF